MRKLEICHCLTGNVGSRAPASIRRRGQFIRSNRVPIPIYLPAKFQLPTMIGYGDSRGSPNLGWGAGTPYRETLGCKFGHCVRVHVDIYRRAKFHLTCSIGCGDNTGPKKSRQNPDFVQNMRQKNLSRPLTDFRGVFTMR